jgi:hypothetical protein
VAGHAPRLYSYIRVPRLKCGTCHPDQAPGQVSCFLAGEFNHNLVPLDFDSPEAEEWWRKQCREADIDPSDFPTVITPGTIRPDGTRHPGRHRYVHDVRGELSNRSGALKAHGIDIRGHGHAVQPPSLSAVSTRSVSRVLTADS